MSNTKDTTAAITWWNSLAEAEKNRLSYNHFQVKDSSSLVDSEIYDIWDIEINFEEAE